MWKECIECRLLPHCPGRCDRMQVNIDTNKKEVEKEEYHA